MQWQAEEPPRPVAPEQIDSVWAEIESQSVAAVVVVVAAGGAQLHAVVGEPRGTVLVYFPPDYEATGTGSLHSVGDRAAAERDEWEPPVSASYLGHHSEFPKWMVVSRAAGKMAMTRFCESPHVPPPEIEWQAD